MQIGSYDTSLWGVVSSHTISPPKVKIKEIEIPGRQGTLDATESLTGYPIFENREIEVRILVTDKTVQEFQTIYDDIYQKIHGRRLSAVFPEDPSYYYIGRWSIDDIIHEHRLVRTIVLKCSAEPYAYKSAETSKTIAIGNLTISSNMPTFFIVNASTQTTIKRGNVTTTYSVGSTVVKYPVLYGEETLTISAGTGTITYREGKL